MQLNFDEVVRVSKKWEQCKFGDYTICLDEVENLGSFIEIEKISKDEETIKVQTELSGVLSSLGISEDDRITVGYDTLIYNKLHS